MQFIQKKNRRVLKPVKQTVFFSSEKNTDKVVNTVKKEKEIPSTPKKEKKATTKTIEVVEKNNLAEENIE